MFELTSLRREDIYLIKEWRNSQMDILRQKEKITDEEQKKYWEEVILPSFSEKHPKMILFSYLKKGILIGYGGLVHIDWDHERAEISFLVNPIYKEESKDYEQAFLAFLALIQKKAFLDLGLHRLYAETFDIRPCHIALLEEGGFSLEGRLKGHVFVRGHFVDTVIHGVLNPNE